MRKNSKFLVFLLVVSSLVIPFTPTLAAPVQPAQETVDRLRYSMMTVAGDWDPAITPGYFLTTSTYLPNCMQTLTISDGNWDVVLKEIIAGLRPEEDRWKTWYPVLATNWTVEYWPEEINTLGFLNKGGVRSLNYTLRENVTFTDGSAWNATVMKWNLDRLFIITSNASGKGDLRNKDNYWAKIKDVDQYYADNPTPGPKTFNVTSRGYSETTMGWYHDGVTNWTAQTDTLIGSFPFLQSVIILDDQPSGGKVQVNYNIWNSYVTHAIGLLGYMSMEYYKDYYDTGIYGWTSSDTPSEHMIGTGPYIYQNDHDNTAGSGGTLAKNYNYWNRTAMEDAGWFDAEYVDVLSWPVGLGEASRNTAMLGHATDFGLDLFQWPLDYDSMVAEPDIIYYTFPDPIDYMTSLTMNAINDTWMSWGGAWDVRNPTIGGGPGVEFNYATMIDASFPVSGISNVPDGLPRDLRKAMSFAFEYDTYINTVLDGRGVRSGGLVGVENVYYNSSLDIAYYNVTYAREVLLNSVPDIIPAVPFVTGGSGTYTNFSQLCIDAGLDENSTDLDWATVAGGSSPLWELNLYYDDFFTPMRNILITSLAKIGVAVSTDPDNYIATYMWDPVSHYWDGTFPVFSAQAWPLDWNMPSTIPEGWIEANNFDPNRGSWRVNPWAPVADPGFDWFPWFNLHFNYDTDIDYWLDRMWMDDTVGKAGWISKICDKYQNEMYAMISISQHQTGLVYWNDWEWNNFTGALSFQRTRHIDPEEEEEDDAPLIFEIGRAHV